MLFTTKELVRSESGFENETNISDATIEGYITQANGELISYIATIYDVSKFTGALFTGSQAASFLQRIETQLASGYLLIDEYGIDARDTDKDGYRKKDDAIKNLQKIIEGVIKLFDVNFNEFPKKAPTSTGVITMTTPDDNPNLDPIFTTKMEF